MKLPSFKRLFESDFAEEFRELVKTLAASYNTDMENVYLALSRRISVQDNIQCTVKNITVEVNANGIPKDAVSFQLDRAGGTQAVTKIIGCLVFTAINETNNAVYPTGTPFITFSQNESTILIEHVAGLPADNVFTLKVVAFN